MSVETDLYSALTGASPAVVTALVSTRIYPGVAPENATVPYIVYSLANTERLHTLAGSGDDARYQMQIDCVANTYTSGKAVATAVVAALQGNGFQQFTYDLYDDVTQRHSMIVGWSFIAA